MKKYNSLIMMALLLAATVGGLVLVSKTAETRKGAYFAGTKLLLQPDIGTGKVGTLVLVDLYVSTGLLPKSITPDYAKVDFVKTRLCFSKNLTIDVGNTTNVVVNSEAFDDLMDVGYVTGAENDCVDVTVKANRQVSELKSGVVRVGLFKFTATRGGLATITIDKSKTEVSGANPDLTSTDMTLEIESVAGSAITIESEVTPTPTCVPRPACLDEVPPCMIPEPIGGWCPVTVTPTPDVCQLTIGRPDGCACMVNAPVNQCLHTCINGVCGILPTVTPTLIPTSTRVPTPTSTLIPTSTRVPTPTSTLIPTSTRVPTATVIPTAIPTLTQAPTATRVPTATLTPTRPVTLTPTSTPALLCRVCPTNFQCYTNGTEYRWFVTGYVWQGFSLASAETCNVNGVTEPTYRSKIKGDANCDGYTDGYDYSIWRREFVDANGTTEADFTGPMGVCDGIVDGYDYSLWRREAIDYGGGRI